MSSTLAQPVQQDAAFHPDAALSPVNFFNTMNAYQRTASLKAAIDLDLFTAINETSGTVAAVAKRVGANQRGIRALCDYLVVLGFLAKYIEEDKASYTLAPDSAMFLDKKSPQYLGGATVFLASKYMTDSFQDFAAVVRAGGPVTDRDVAQDLPVWVDFARGMAPLMFLVAAETAKLVSLGSPSKVLDIAASHGLFGIHVAKLNPGAEVVAVDFPAVLSVAKENAEKFGVSECYRLLPGDALEVEFGTGYQAVLISNLLHHWDRETIHRLLQKVHASLAMGGQVVIVEFVPNEDRVSPPIPAWFVMNMLANTKGGDAYTASEFTQMLDKAGFAAPEFHALLPTAQTAILASKR